MSRVFVEDLYGSVLHRPELTERSPNSTYFSRLRNAIGRWVKAFVEGVIEARRLSRTYDELAAMSDRELHDIGINRTDIPAAVMGSRYKNQPADWAAPHRLKRQSRKRNS